MAEGLGVFYAVVSDLSAAKSREIGAGAKVSAEVFGEGADIGARRNVSADFEIRISVF